MMDPPQAVLDQALKKANQAYGTSAWAGEYKVVPLLENKPHLREKNMANMEMGLV